MLPLFGEEPPDTELDDVASALTSLDPSGERVATVLRDTLDQVLDGRRHGRWDYRELRKTEKTYTGTLVEINLHREFQFGDGEHTDYEIAGVDVDCKYSQTLGGWEIGPQLVGHLLLVVWADDYTSSWRAGLVRAAEDALRTSRNQDLKRKLNNVGMARVRWLWSHHGRLAEHLLLHLEPSVRDRILGARGARGPAGQARLNQLCLEPATQGRILRRAVVETVGHGLDDPLKRMRSNGGARDQLRPRGVLVLGHQDDDPRIAEELGFPRPRKGEFLAVRVVPADLTRPGARPTCQINGIRYVRAGVDDPEIEAPAPSRGRSGRA